jgi:hypothetical protein
MEEHITDHNPLRTPSDDWWVRIANSVVTNGFLKHVAADRFLMTANAVETNGLTWLEAWRSSR